MTVTRIVSGGQTGVDRAALDVALERGIPCGGWCPAGRLAEDGMIPIRYPLLETPATDYAERTRWNVRDSTGTLVLTWGEPSGGTAFTVQCAADLGRPCLIIDLQDPTDVETTRRWLESNGIETLNVAGPRASTAPGAYPKSRDFLLALLWNPVRDNA